MSLFPFLSGNTSNTENEALTLPMFKEYAWDFDADCFKLRNGRVYVVEGNEAVKVWAYKALKTERFRYFAYSWNFGSELENLIGSGWTKDAIQSEAKRYVEEALLISPYITGVSDVQAEFVDGRLKLSVNIDTVYGEGVEVNVR